MDFTKQAGLKIGKMFLTIQIKFINNEVVHFTAVDHKLLVLGLGHLLALYMFIKILRGYCMI